MTKRLRPALAATVWATLLAWPAAQSGIPQATQLDPGTVKSGDGKYIVIGCISREGQNVPPTFVITDSRSKPPAVYRLDGDADLLRMHVGHTVEIGGAIAPASTARTGDEPAVATVKVEALTYLSTTCVKLQ